MKAGAKKIKSHSKPGRYVLNRAEATQVAQRKWNKKVAAAGWDNAALNAAVAMDVAENAVAEAVRAMPRSRAMNAEELKGVDTVIPSGDAFISTTNTNSRIYLLNAIQPGTGSFNRTGRKITMKSLRVFLHFTLERVSGSGNLPGNAARIAVVYDRQPSGVLPAFDEIFAHTTQAGTVATDFFDNLRFDNTERFRVLRDARIGCRSLSYPSADGFGGFEHYVWEEFIPLNGMETVFQGNASPATITDVSTGAIYLIVRAEKDAADSVWKIDKGSFARLRYYG